MSRTRPFLLAALAGILITTGGCADSATAPSAATGPVLDRATGEAAASTNQPGTAGPGQGRNDDGEVTVQSGYIAVGT